MARRTDPFTVEITPELIVRAYRAGIFPMAEGRDDPQIHWVDPRRRGILPLDGFHISRSLRRRLLRADWQVRIDTAFSAVSACLRSSIDCRAAR